MVAIDTTQLHIYLIGFFALAAIALVLSLGVVTQAVVSHRSARRLARQQSRRTHVGRLALHH